MFALLWLTLLFIASARRNNADEVTSTGHIQEIAAEVGLCVVIPCYFISKSDFSLQHAVWYKCEQNCTDSDIILRLRNTSTLTQSELGRRVSLLEPHLSQMNCSIIINDLKKSDSGSYQLRVMNGTTSHTANITVKDLTQKPTVVIPPLTKGQQATLSCTAPGHCSGSDPGITWTWRRPGEKDTPFPGNSTTNKKQSSDLTFTPSVNHHGMEVTCRVRFTNDSTTEETKILEVTYAKALKITGKTSIRKGDTLNLTCSLDSFPLSVVTWTKPGSNQSHENNTGSVTLVITNVSIAHSGVYICTAKHGEKNLRKEVTVTVALFSKILSSSGCINHSKSLTCTCVSEGFPLPTIRWPLLENHTEIYIITTISNHTVNSTFTLTVQQQSYTSVQCVSSNKVGDITETLNIKTEEQEQEDPQMKIFRFITRLEIVIAFLIGALLSASICCLVRKCHRTKQRTYRNLAETLEMVTSQEDPLMAAGQAGENGRAIDQDATQGEGDAAAGKPDVDYSNLDFSKIKRKSAVEAEAAETEYAEIKKEDLREDEEGKDEEEMMGNEGEKGECVTDEKEGEGVYSNVEDIMGQREDSVE
ncbi:sialic acid-binding Ig-like lectin 14 [Notolabrus celidotus]|uniref:sialic acid-binding Ig-like lectin 14 n=1 Tax=Notolabrus celidotus TaxID=1203425 RepID=UPI00148FC9E5|nr:sialic acid-binding Ig-like lectin 14 [Notolabrus celidotus]XP_034552907.1 sialic acid-binding Ig-like lectin 14 [Notolabrus celidotus]